MFGEDEDPFAAEPLEVELEEWLDDSALGKVLRHPLVYSVPYIPGMNRILNLQLRTKKYEVEQALHGRRWSSYLLLHERPWRADALQRVASQMTDEEFWSQLSWVWQDSENIPENAELWDELLRSGRPGREYLMKPAEREALAKLPERIVVYQGHTDRRRDGWSFTTDERTAIWFAHRFASLEDARAMVTTGSVLRADVSAYLLGRNEHEILVDPDLIEIHTTRRLRPR